MSGETEQQVIHYFKRDELGAARCGASVHPADHYRYSDRWPEVTCGGCRSHWSAPGSARPPAPDAAGIKAALAAGLAAHADCVINGDDGPGAVTSGMDTWSCGLTLPFRDDLDDAARAHLAAALLPVVTQAQAEAVRLAADEVADWEFPLPDDASKDAIATRVILLEQLARLVTRLRARADESGAR